MMLLANSKKINQTTTAVRNNDIGNKNIASCNLQHQLKDSCVVSQTTSIKDSSVVLETSASVDNSINAFNGNITINSSLMNVTFSEIDTANVSDLINFEPIDEVFGSTENKDHSELSTQHFSIFETITVMIRVNFKIPVQTIPMNPSHQNPLMMTYQVLKIHRSLLVMPSHLLIPKCHQPVTGLLILAQLR